MTNNITKRYQQLKDLATNVKNSKYMSNGEFSNGWECVNNELFDSWKIQVKSFIQKNFTETSIHYQEFEKNENINMWTTNYDIFKKLNTILESLEVEFDDIVNASTNENKPHTIKNKVFIVHGHDDLAISEVKNTLIQLGLEPIVLRDKPSSSKTIIEKIEHFSNEVRFAIILYTPCDIGGKDKDTLKPRARQNVVLEHGYLMAKIGRNNTCALIKEDVEKPGDIDGIVYIPMDTHNAWRYSIVDELKSSGFNVKKDDL